LHGVSAVGRSPWSASPSQRAEHKPAAASPGAGAVSGWQFQIVDNLGRRINTIDIGDVDRGVTYSRALTF
jgi:hypothetical protein